MPQNRTISSTATAARQRLPSGHPALQVRRRHSVAGSGDGEAAGLGEEQGLLGVRDLFEEGDGGVMGGIMMSKVKHRGSSILVGDYWVGASLEEDVDVEDCFVGSPARAGVMKSGAASGKAC